MSEIAPAKAATHAWAKELSRRVGRHGVTVNCIAPANIMSEQILRKYTPEQLKKTEGQIPIGRWGKPEEFAELAVHIVQNNHLNGETIRLDGSLRMAPR